MAQFHQHPDGLIYVRTPRGEYADTIENFARDFGGAPPALPMGVAERIYDDSKHGGRHALLDAKGNHRDSGPVPWPVGDKFIAGVVALLKAQAKRQPKPVPAVIQHAPNQKTSGTSTMAS